jgi:outer membrane biosynthesis protein TonB
VPDPNLVGEVYLKASIDADGSPPTVSAPMGQAAIEVSPPTVPLPGVEKPKHTVTPPKPAPEPTLVAPKSAPVPSGSAGSIAVNSAGTLSESAPTGPSGASERLFISELPQGDFVGPVVPDPNLVGEVHLRALVDADGSVKEVTVVSGNPKLAEAGMRAVRRWHYSQNQLPGHTGEGEALIRMRFFGPDAVSITSVAR